MAKDKWRLYVKILIMVSLIASVVILFLPFALTIFIGGIFAVVIFPIYSYLCKKKWPPYLAALTTVLAFNIIFLVPTVLVTIKGANETFEFVSNFITERQGVENLLSEKQRIQKAEDFLDRITSGLGISLPDFSDLGKNLLASGGRFLMDNLKLLFTQIPEFVLALFIIALTMFFALVDHQAIKRHFKDVSLLSEVRAEKLARTIYVTCKSVILANVIAGGVQALMIAAAAALTKTGDFFVVIFVTFVLSFIPVIGASPMAFFLAAVAALQGDWVACSVMIVVGSLSGVSDNIIRPWVLSEAAETHAFLNLISILGGIVLFGLPGLFLGPLLLSLAITCVPIYQEDIRLTK